nr:oxysterol-binding protein-related protein 4C-like [Tanacetum cinerariifolium]
MDFCGSEIRGKFFIFFYFVLLQLPPIFNIPKSQLQCYGESVYSVNNDILSRCANGGTPLERFTSVVAWSISTLRPLMFGVAPFNPILGETHHVSRGNLNVLLEQVSHHPPVSASIETRVLGKRQLKLLNHGETYVMNSPNLVIKFLPVPDVEWLGNVTIRCQESGLEAELCFKGKPFLGRHSNYRSIRGKIVSLSKMETIYEISGHWDRNDVISALKTPIVKDVEGLWASESAVIWANVNECILNKSWDKANDAKTSIEEKEREVARSRKSKGEAWVPKHFVLSDCKETGEWDWELGANGTVGVYIGFNPIDSSSVAKIVTQLFDPFGLWASESAVIWANVNECILNKSWDKANDAKTSIEEKEREVARSRKSKGEAWVPKHFVLSDCKETGEWDWE